MGTNKLLNTKISEASLRALFHELTGFEAHNFQIDVARRLLEGENLVLVSPTGSGKSWAALLAFVYAKRYQMPFADRLIYTFPLRTLTTALYQQYRERLKKEGLEPTLQMGGMERGEGDPFFDQGDVVFTTIDQLLSSYIGLPHALEDMEERNVTEEWVRATVEEPDFTGEGTMAASSRIAASGGPWCGWSTMWAAGST